MGSDAFLWSAAQEERHLLLNEVFSKKDVRHAERGHAERVSHRTPSESSLCATLEELGFPQRTPSEWDTPKGCAGGTSPRGTLNGHSEQTL